MGLFGRRAAKKAEEERIAKAEAERKAREEAERRAKAEAERKAREEAERRAKAEAERKAREEAESAGGKLHKATLLIKKEFEARNLKSIRVNVQDNVSVVIVGGSGEKAPGRDFFFFSDDEKNDVTIRCEPIATIPEDKILPALRILNNYAVSHRYNGFYLDKQNRLMLQFDLPQSVSDESVGPIAHEYIARAVHIIDDIYPDVMKLIWG